MKGDFSRHTYDPTKHYSRVLFQQGRPQLDADINEQHELTLDHLRTLTVDLLGKPFGTRENSDCFRIGLDVDGVELKDLIIGTGFYYVHGRRCVADGGSPSFRHSEQPHVREHQALPQPPFYVYLKVWDRVVTAVQDPDLHEVALGPNTPDTCLRTQLVWQVIAEHLPTIPGLPEFESDLPPEEVADRWAAWALEDGGGHRPAMRVRSRPAGDARSGGYLGPENQLYRVEVHTGGSAGTATFTFSRDNGATVLAVRAVEGDRVEVKTLGPESMPIVSIGDWVELMNDALDLRQERGPLRMVEDVDVDGSAIRLHQAVGEAFDADPVGRPLLRSWGEHVAQRRDNADAPTDNAVLIVEGEGDDDWTELEDGVQVQFTPEGRHYRPGDYWLVPARQASADVLWPRDPAGSPLWRTARGPDVCYAPLARVRGHRPAELDDLRFFIKPQAYRA